MYRNVVFLILTIAFIVGTLRPISAQELPKVVATASIFADMAENIAGGQVSISMIVPIGGDPHLHEPTPRDAQLVSEADLILKNGLTFEGWLNELIENSGTKAQVVTITQGVAPIESQQYKNATDPHAWMDLNLGLIYIKNIKDALIALVPEQADIFEFNYKVYRQQLLDLDKEIKASIETIPAEKRVLITSHDAFQYYGRRYGLQLESVLGTSTDAEVQTSDIIRLNKIIKATAVPAVFIESTVNPKLLRQLAVDNDIVVGGKLFADSIGNAESEAPTYLKMLQHNTNTIVSALRMEKPVQEDGGKAEEEGGNWLFSLLGVGVIALLGFVFFIRKANG